ncbi:MAG: type II toxin-antitoxin system Phd/YefM family antitoxin [Candidatus Eremiobacteraeota bacterium]|nr:type II toxin-antitoxin system Phd/YefM family antitoxin [Candidatus Eremiobacteraeota bacterium]MCW5866169.1 type II toxin-antitoxin system Phd/YefM family antitoxin [Candidatus Eremiobacteraeota bacterium]
MQRISAARFKAQCLQLRDTVGKEHTEVIITKRGQPVAKLVPYQQEALPLFGLLAGTVQICSDLTVPIEVEWEAMNE